MESPNVIIFYWIFYYRYQNKIWHVSPKAGIWFKKVQWPFGFFLSRRQFGFGRLVFHLEPGFIIFLVVV